MDSINSISICLNCYVVRFREKNKSEFKSVNDVFGTDDFVKIMQDFIKIIDSKNAFENKKKDRILYLEQNIDVSNSKNIYAAIIRKGHNGPETSIDEILKDGGVKKVGTVSAGQYHCLPYFFLLYFNAKKPNQFIFLAQSYRQFGFKEVFEEAFKSFVSIKSPSTTLLINTLSLASLFEKYVNEGKINKIHFIKHGLLKNVEGVLQGDKFNEEDYEMEMSITSKNGFVGLKKNLKYDNSSFIEQVQIDGFDYNEATADIVVAGRKRVMSLTRPSTFSASYDITKDIVIDKNSNLPNFNDIFTQAKDILNNELIPYL